MYGAGTGVGQGVGNGAAERGLGYMDKGEKGLGGSRRREGWVHTSMCPCQVQVHCGDIIVIVVVIVIIG